MPTILLQRSWTLTLCLTDMDSYSITSSIGEKKRLVIKNPDGSFMHCYKAGERDSIYLPLDKKRDNKDDIDALTISDTDLEFIVDNYEQFDQGIF